MSLSLWISLFNLLSVTTRAQVIGDTAWDTIITTAFNPQTAPLNESQAIANGWTLFFGCDDSDEAPGNVYWYDGDLATMPIYNADGNIAGIIIGMDDPGESQHGRAPWTKYTLENDTFWGIEAIFRDPTTICTSGSTGDVAYGDRLWFANGSHTEYHKIPLNESYCALTNKGWDEGGCKDSSGFPQFRMGVHYWHGSSADLDCDEAYPIFLLYDNGILHAWGVAMGNTDRPYLSSPRWEHPPGYLLTSFFADGESPTCLVTQNNTMYNSLHVWMDFSVWNHTTPCVDEIDDNITTIEPIDCSPTTTSSGSNGDGDKSEVKPWMFIVPIAVVVVLIIAGSLYWTRCRNTSKDTVDSQALLEDGQYHTL